MSQGYNYNPNRRGTPFGDTSAFSQRTTPIPYKNVHAQCDYLASKMPSANPKHPNPIESLSIEELIYLQTYLQKLIDQKMLPQNTITGQQNRATQFYDPITREMPTDWRNFRKPDASTFDNNKSDNMVPGSRGGTATRNGKKSENNDYYNPYEYGARQNQLGQLNKPMGKINYNLDQTMLDRMGIGTDNSRGKFPSHIRNVDVESSLLQQESTHLPGQREITQKEVDRFELLPFDPQDPNHIVWPDMPRGGHPTRVDRLEY